LKNHDWGGVDVECRSVGFDKEPNLEKLVTLVGDLENDDWRWVDVALKKSRFEKT